MVAIQTAGRALRKLPFPLEQGVYLQSEAALYTGLPRITVRRWLRLERGEKSVRAVAEQPRISFLDLISLRAVAALRAYGLSLEAIGTGAEKMRRHLGIDHPLASENLKTDGVHLYYSDAVGPLAVNRGGQYAAQELIDEYLRHVKYRPFGERVKLAASWEPPGVVLDPELQRGAPCVAGSRVQVAMLKRYADAGDSPELLAQLLELDPAAIRQALNWYEGLKPAA